MSRVECYANVPTSDWLCDEFGCNYRPEAEGLTGSEWLLKIAAFIRSEVGKWGI